MNFWTSPDIVPPEIDLLVRRWALPAGRVADLRLLLDAEADGGTACTLPAASPADPSGWGAAALAAPLASAADSTAPRPLVLHRHGGRAYVQSWKFFQAERTIARELLARAARPAPSLTRTVDELLAALGPDQVNTLQARAITCALQHTLALITGGPGTGKTHTIARLLALLAAAAPAARPVIRLAAPTGKAADRMREAIENAAAGLPATLPADTTTALKTAATGACTLHKLLGFNPATGRCRHGPDAPLHCDVLIVDECSMVDTLLWQALLRALPADARLILLGDPHQLESVSAGDVLGSLVRHARAHPAGPLAAVWVELAESRRFRDRADIGALAAAVVNFDADAAVRLLAARRAPEPAADAPVSAATPAEATPPPGGLVWLGDHDGRFSWTVLPPAVRDALAAVADAPAPAAALAALARVRLLTAHRENALGASGLNAAIQRHLAQRPGVLRALNQPVIIDHNDAETGLTNGSVGIVMEHEGVRAAFFPTADATAPRRVLLGQLPAHSSAWAMTIHRSQGSEFEQVVVVLPRDESALATRELIYTGITRASVCVYVWGAESTVRAALGERALRCTLLEAGLGG